MKNNFIQNKIDFYIDVYKSILFSPLNDNRDSVVIPFYNESEFQLEINKILNFYN